MMRKNLYRNTLSALIVLLSVQAHAQDGRGVNYSTADESMRCGMDLSTYKEFFRMKLYDYAYESWWNVMNNCPESSEQMYIDGVTMYRSFIDSTPDLSAREGLIDTLMLIYDRRMQYFGGKGNILGRKGRDLLAYRGEDPEQVQLAYGMLDESIRLQGEESQEATLLFFVTASAVLHNEGMVGDDQAIANYFRVLRILDEMKGSSLRRERTREQIDEIVLKEDLLNCEALDRYFEPLMEDHGKDKTSLENMIDIYALAACDRSELYLIASENLYLLEPGPESARSLALLFVARGNNEKAAAYLQEAVRSEGVDPETRAKWFYELAVVSNALNKPCEAIGYAREAISLKSDFGKAYMALGDAYIESRVSLGDDFQQSTAFWAAADMFSKAGKVDPSVLEDSKTRLEYVTSQFPIAEDIFFRDLKEGDSYRVGGCINENTTVRPGD
jgi:hypothetical protein